MRWLWLRSHVWMPPCQHSSQFTAPWQCSPSLCWCVLDALSVPPTGRMLSQSRLLIWVKMLGSIELATWFVADCWWCPFWGMMSSRLVHAWRAFTNWRQLSEWLVKNESVQRYFDLFSCAWNLICCCYHIHFVTSTPFFFLKPSCVYEIDWMLQLLSSKPTWNHLLGCEHQSIHQCIESGIAAFCFCKQVPCKTVEQYRVAFQWTWLNPN